MLLKMSIKIRYGLDLVQRLSISPLDLDEKAAVGCLKLVPRNNEDFRTDLNRLIIFSGTTDRRSD